MQNSQKLYLQVRDYYLQRMPELNDKQFHFVSRLFLYNDKKGKIWAERLKVEKVGNGSLQDMSRILIDLSKSASKEKSRMKFLDLRKPYLQKYQNTFQVLPLLFRLLLAWTVYDLNYFHLLKNHIDLRSLDQELEKLKQDREAIKILSTHAVNFMYLYSRLIKRDEYAFEPSLYLDIAKQDYDNTNSSHISLQAYLLTHAIIAESLFYARHIPTDRVSIYTQMLEFLEDIIDNNFNNVNLDNKLEFIVCANICNYDSRLADRIADESRNSVSPNGKFIVDVHNSHRNINQDFIKSEHRNMLFIISNYPFKPRLNNYLLS